MKAYIDQETWDKFFSEELDSDINLCTDLLKIFKKYSNEICNLHCDGSFKSIDSLRAHAHKLRASCAFFGANELELFLYKLENAVKNGNLKEIVNYHDEVKELTQATLSELETLLNGQKPYLVKEKIRA